MPGRSGARSTRAAARAARAATAPGCACRAPGPSATPTAAAPAADTDRTNSRRASAPRTPAAAAKTSIASSSIKYAVPRSAHAVPAVADAAKRLASPTSRAAARPGKRRREVDVARGRRTDSTSERGHEGREREAHRAQLRRAPAPGAEHPPRAPQGGRDQQRPRPQVQRQFEQVLCPGNCDGRAAYCSSCGASTCAKRPTRLFQKNTLRCSAVGPRYTDQTQARITPPAAELRHTAPSAAIRASASPTITRVPRVSTGTIQAAALLLKKAGGQRRVHHRYSRAAARAGVARHRTRCTVPASATETAASSGASVASQMATW
jgi:hypothetical protein